MFHRAGVGRGEARLRVGRTFVSRHGSAISAPPILLIVLPIGLKYGGELRRTDRPGGEET